MHKSLRLKLTLMLMVIVLGIVICSTLISGLFLGDFYMMGKQKGLIETYNDVNRPVYGQRRRDPGGGRVSFG